MSKAYFRTHALLKNIIGKDLITNDNIAVLELVKNAFDAGSPDVKIAFENLLVNDDRDKLKLPTPNTSKMVIRDKGVGMSSDDLIDKWLNVAYSEKKEEKEKFGRILAGNKGVGRFSCDRLGKLLTIYTRKKDQSYNKLFIDWRWFEVEGEIEFNMQDVELTIEEIQPTDFQNKTGYKAFSQGTLLEISYLRDKWTIDKIVSLRRDLEKFINPNQVFLAAPFSINIEAVEFIERDKKVKNESQINGPVKNQIFDKLNFRTTSITSSIDEEGEKITTILQDRGQILFKLVEKNPYNDLRKITVTLYFLSQYGKVYFRRQTGVRSKDFGSVFLFINGFRIPPYGDDGDDWLGMEIRKGQGYNRYLGTREVVGRIEINDDKGLFQIISNRAGVVNNNAYKQLTLSTAPYGFFYKALTRLEKFVRDGIKWDKGIDISEDEIGLDDFEEIYLQDDLTRSKNVLSVINRIIDIKKENIINLEINDFFISDLLDTQAEKATREIEDILQELSSKSKDINPAIINKMIKRLDTNTAELTSLMDTTSKYKEVVGKHDLDNIQAELNNTKKKLNSIQIELAKESEARKAAEKAQKKLEEELKLEQEKNIYLRTSDRSLSEDAKGLIHNIKITSTKISASVENLYHKILHGNIKTNDILKTLGVIKFQSDKALKISKIITRSNFKTDKNEQVVDVVKYIRQYIALYQDIYEKSDLDFDLDAGNSTLERKISILEMAVILDDLISNSEKAQASKIKVVIENKGEDGLRILFSDNGLGVDSQFLSNPEKIFELGVTTTNGSGIGLHSVKTGLKSMKADISFIGNGKLLKGACFEINF